MSSYLVGPTAMAAAGAPTASSQFRDSMHSPRVKYDVDIDLGESLPLGGSGLSKAYRRSLLRRAGIQLPTTPRDALLASDYQQPYEPGTQSARSSSKHVRFALPDEVEQQDQQQRQQPRQQQRQQQPPHQQRRQRQVHHQLNTLGRGHELAANEADLLPVYPSNPPSNSRQGGGTTTNALLHPDNNTQAPSEYVTQYRQPHIPVPSPSKWARRRPVPVDLPARPAQTPESEYDLMFQWPHGAPQARRHLMASDIRTQDNTTAAAAMHLHPNDIPNTTHQAAYRWTPPSHKLPVRTEAATQATAPEIEPTALGEGPTSEYDQEYQWPGLLRDKALQTSKQTQDSAAQVSEEDLQPVSKPPRQHLRYHPVSEYDRSFISPDVWRSFYAGPRVVDAATETTMIAPTADPPASLRMSTSEIVHATSTAGRPLPVAPQLHSQQVARAHHMPAESQRTLRNSTIVPTILDARQQRPAGMSSAELEHVNHRVILPQQHTADYDTEYQNQYLSWQPTSAPAPARPSHLGHSEYDVSYAARTGIPAPYELPSPRGRAPDLPGHMNPAMVEAQDQAYARPYVVTDWYGEMLQAREAAQSYMERDRRLDHVGQRLAEIGLEQERLLAEKDADEDRRHKQRLERHRQLERQHQRQQHQRQQQLEREGLRTLTLNDTYDKDEEVVEHGQTTRVPNIARFEALAPTQTQSEGSWRDQSEAFELAQGGYQHHPDDVALAASQSFEYMTESSLPLSQDTPQDGYAWREEPTTPSAPIQNDGWATLPRHYPQ
eukprot:m.256766 g.256766  ORF g.256766 m.256766 type:complete len:775 (-) comp17574_c0_seq6:5321-7645(-)